MMETECHGEIVLAIEDQKDQIFERYSINGVTVLVDSTPFGDPDVITVHNHIKAMPALLEACYALDDWDGGLGMGCEQLDIARQLANIAIKKAKEGG